MFQKGCTVMRSEPFAYILSNTYKDERCHYCLAFISSSKNCGHRCTQCAFVKYCNKLCQRKAWPYHKKECVALKKVYPRIPPDTARILALIIWKLHGSGANEFEMVGENKRTFSDLLSHSDDIKKDKNRMEHFLSIFHVLKDYVGEALMPPAEELLHIFGKVAVNCYTISDSDMQPVGAGVYLGASALDHSCSPNAQVIFDKFNLSVNVTEDIESDDLSKVFISYIDVLEPLEERRRNLLTQYYFQCTCALCSNDEMTKLMESTRCRNENCTAPVDSTLDNCSACGTASVRHIDIQKLHAELQSEIPRFNSLMKVGKHMTVYRDGQSLLNEISGALHPMNARLVKLLDCIVESCIALEHWSEAVEYISLTLPSYRFYYGPMNPLFGLQLAKLGKLHNFLGNLAEAEKYLLESLATIKMLYGDKHDAYAMVKDILLQCHEERRSLLGRQGNALTQ